MVFLLCQPGFEHSPRCGFYATCNQDTIRSAILTGVIVWIGLILGLFLMHWFSLNAHTLDYKICKQLRIIDAWYFLLWPAMQLSQLLIFRLLGRCLLFWLFIHDLLHGLPNKSNHNYCFCSNLCNPIDSKWQAFTCLLSADHCIMAWKMIRTQ